MSSGILDLPEAGRFFWVG